MRVSRASGSSALLGQQAAPTYVTLIQVSWPFKTSGCPDCALPRKPSVAAILPGPGTSAFRHAIHDKLASERVPHLHPMLIHMVHTSACHVIAVILRNAALHIPCREQVSCWLMFQVQIRIVCSGEQWDAMLAAVAMDHVSGCHGHGLGTSS